LRIGASQQGKPEKRIPDRAGYPHEVSGARVVAPDLHSCGDFPDGGHRQNGRPGCRHRIAAQEVDPEPALILGKPSGELGKPIRAECGRKRRRQEIIERPRPHRREIRQIDPQ
jgi:hypothetical protein